ncbi:Ppx/GppA phosphatase family protein [Flavobacterium phragmitis]|uniref:Ppx/GppA phosphatase family protein n=1 Tax=Flavobacterium phragmitis TaxID=739143 RepID=A0A1I1XQW2_9FLAO|nr:hypothetical protein [Flavobacterium phragmitis]SFE09694.1 Ppx/GppA phosphatase family protein [Flavobacterium phragmitis]
MKNSICHTNLFTLMFCVLCLFQSFGQKGLYAGIEIGSKGIKIALIDVKSIKRGDYLILKNWIENVGVTYNTSQDGSLAKKEINRAAATVSENLTMLKNSFRLKKENVFIVVSSGVAKARNVKDLLDTIKSITTITPDVITAEDEAKMLFKGLIPPAEYKDAILLDIGGGNTKGGCLYISDADKSKFITLKLDYGTIKLTEIIDHMLLSERNRNDIEEFENKLFEYDPILRENIEKMFSENGLSAKKTKIFLSGGAVWAFTTLYYGTESRESFLPLQLEDIINYDAVLRNNFSRYKNLAVTDPNAAKVLNTYDQKHLIAANNILLDCLEAVDGLKSKQIYFSANGHIAWLVCYVAERSRKNKIVF